MLAVRVIPCLDVDEGRVVKGTKFKDLKTAGDPVELAKAYNDQGADELCFLDIGATPGSRETMVALVEKVSEQVFIPLSVGGGVRSVDDMRKLLHAGADKVAVCSAALRDPEILREGARMFGSQCVVLSIDAKRAGSTWHAWRNGGREDTGIDAVEWAVRSEELGAGEILLNSIDRDGTQEGYDIDLVRAVSEKVTIPVIASGGAGTLAQTLDVIREGRADAVLLASMFHEKKLTVRDVKTYLGEKGVAVRW
ncbi:MAG: imidazole glycerol phosphate synthase subunit HisF [Candidatus Aminicenantales bacterium]